MLTFVLGAIATVPMATGGDAATCTSANRQSQTQENSSSNRKHGTTSHHTTVAEEEDAFPELTKAEALIQKQNFAQAETVLRKFVETDASNYVGWFDLGFVENALGKTEDSIAAYRKSVDAKPDVFESNLNLGLQLARTGQPDAEKFLRAATQLTPTSHVEEGQARAWLSLAHVIEATKPDEAISAYQKASTLEPHDSEPHLAAGLLLEKQNRFADAEDEYQQALKADPASSDAMTGLANIYMRGRRFPEAEAQLRKVVAAHPADAAAHIQLGRVLAAEGKNVDAIDQLQAGAKASPADGSVDREIADLFYAGGKYKEAESAYRTLIAAHPEDAELHDALGQSLLRQKKFAAAQREFQQAVKLKPNLAEAHWDLAFTAGENGDYALVLKELDTRAKTEPETPSTYFLRASAYDHLKDVKKAVANYHLFLQTANGKYPEQEWQAKHRLIALEPKR